MSGPLRTLLLDGGLALPAIALGLAASAEGRVTVQQQACSSPVWYRPDGRD